MLNNTRVDFDILRPCEAAGTRSKYMAKPEVVLENIRRGTCHQVYGISDFNQNARLGALKLHEKYQASIKTDENTFRRTNGEFTKNADNMNKNKFV